MPGPDIVVAGHVCLDVIPTFPEHVHDHAFEPGSLLEVGPLVLATGGVVSNVGLALHRLGLPVKLIGKVGDDLFGSAILQILRSHEEKLAEDMIVSGRDATSYTIVLSPPGADRIFLHAPGANDTFRPRDVDVGMLRDARVFHFGYPTIMEQTYADEGRALAHLFGSVRKRGAAVSMDMAQIDPNSKAARIDWMRFLERVLPQVDLFGPSVGEVLDMLGRKGERTGEGASVDGALLIEVADRLLALGAAVVALKLGSNGILLRSTSSQERLAAVPGIRLGDRWAGRTLLQPCFEVDVVGTTGAGDCTLAGLLAAVTAGQTPEDSLRSAAAVGAFSVEQEDSTSGVPAWGDVQARLRSGWPLRGVELDLAGWSWRGDLGIWAGPGDAG